MDLEQFVLLRKIREKLQSEKDKIEGKLEHLRAKLKEDHECSSLQEAEKMLAAWKKQQDKYLKDLREQEARWEELYGDKLGV